MKHNNQYCTADEYHSNPDNEYELHHHSLGELFYIEKGKKIYTGHFSEDWIHDSNNRSNSGEGA